MKSMPRCSFDGCLNSASPKASRGLCNSHYWQLHKGRPLTPIKVRRDVVLPWMQEHVSHDGAECLMWPFGLKANGYGQVKYQGKMHVASRLMCTFAHGDPPTLEHEAAHSCGNGHLGCVNPGHLRWATPIENKADMIEHGTRPMGETIAWSFLSEKRVKAIREFAHTVSRQALSDLFGIKRAHVNKIVARSIWRHI